MLSFLSLSHFRNIQELAVDLSPGLNLFYGTNGAGKTSVLESIYYLLHGKTFRSTAKDNLIRSTAPSLAVFARLKSKDGSIYTVGIEKLKAGKQSIKLNQDRVGSISKISRLLPLKLITSLPQSLLLNGPQARRSFLDWGLFHVKQDFFLLWKAYSKAISSRNSLLKLKIFDDELDYWENKIVELGTILHEQRLEHVQDLTAAFAQLDTIGQQLQPNIQFSYNSGWDNELTLKEALQSCRGKDMALGYTSIGPHRADLLVLYQGIPAAEYLSAGQLKLLSYRMHLLQGNVLHQQLNQAPVFIVDDLSAELDQDNVSAVLDAMHAIGAQQIITTLEPLPALSSTSMFHVEHGAICST